MLAPLVGALLALSLAAPSEPELVAAVPPTVMMGAIPTPPGAVVMGSVPPGTPSVVMGAVPPGTSSVLLNALPPPPDKVVRETRTYGTITIDHKAHLARKISCKACHGEGQVSKIPRMPPRQGHDTCRKCHVEIARGPTDCRGCHVVAPAAQTAVAAAAPAAGSTQASTSAPATAGGTAATLIPSHGAPAAPGGAVATPVGAPVPVDALASAAPAARLPGEVPVSGYPGGFLEDEDAPPTFHRVLEAGFAVRSGTEEGVRVGPSARLITRLGRAVMVHSVEWSGGVNGRTLLLIGGGALIPVDDRVAFLVAGLGGADATGGKVVEILPAAGASVGVQWVRAVPWLDTLGLTVSGVSDLVRRRNAFGDQVGELTFGVSMSAGFRMGR